MTDFSKGGWSKLNDDSWMSVKGGRLDVAKPGNLGIYCLKCNDGNIIANCLNCGSGTYKIGYNSAGIMGLFCSQCEQGFTSVECSNCGCKNPISQNTIVKKGCYIVTASCGYDSDEIWFFYDFRDKYLSKSRAGNLLIRLYYAISPFLAGVIEKHLYLKRLSRDYIIQPIHKILSMYIAK